MILRVFPHPFPPACATAWGDDRYGLWCEITVKGIVQRLRWIDPGIFWMGSSNEERVRFSGNDKVWLDLVKDEAPRHRVRLTDGFWLADTTCTQVFWFEVLGGRPSHFKGSQELPVEQVSWDSVVKKFLPALNGMLVGVECFLPTEAQWEYACRSGTVSEYFFGADITNDQSNFSGKCTVPVKEKQVNGWGLYQMHGNVWEWCADARLSYSEEILTNPCGAIDDAVRVLRGGSWRSSFRSVRSAYRLGERRDARSDDVGFRFALRSVEPSR